MKIKEVRELGEDGDTERADEDAAKMEQAALPLHLWERFFSITMLDILGSVGGVKDGSMAGGEVSFFEPHAVPPLFLTPGVVSLLLLMVQTFES